MSSAIAIKLHIRRQANRTSQPYYQTFTLTADPQHHTVLDLLHRVQWEQDGTLVFRRNCRNVICGSCGMRINGKSSLACQHTASAVMTPTGEITIEPMQNLPVIRDLVVDMQNFWNNLHCVDPYVASDARQPKDQEFRQTPAQRAKLQASANCILCGCCYSECNALVANPNFVGPHALAKAYRLLADNRDQATEDRLTKYNFPNFVWDCTRCYQCNEVCPVGVQPLDRISQIKQAILQQADSLPPSTPILHRQTMVELLQQDGWIDESKFGLRVVGHNFRNWRGILSLIPLGLRMVWKGKMPYPWQFERSPAVAELQQLIARVFSRKTPNPAKTSPPAPHSQDCQ